MKPTPLTALGLLAVGLAGCADGFPAGPDDPTARRGISVRGIDGLTVARGKTADVTIDLARENFNGPVEITLADLPDGVSLVTKDTTIPAGRDSLTITLRAGPDARLGGHIVGVVARGSGEKDVGAKGNFALEVTPGG